MKKTTLWKIIFFVGLCPFIAPFLTGFYNMLLSPSWTLVDWLILYSVIYWPTYLLGLALLVLSVVQLKKHRANVS